MKHKTFHIYYNNKNGSWYVVPKKGDAEVDSDGHATMTINKAAYLKPITVCVHNDYKSKHLLTYIEPISGKHPFEGEPEKARVKAGTAYYLVVKDHIEGESKKVNSVVYIGPEPHWFTEHTSSSGEVIRAHTDIHIEC